MDKKISSQELYNIIKNNEIIGVGSCAIIYKYSDDLLFKFKARDFADALGIETYKLFIEELPENIQQSEEV